MTGTILPGAAAMRHLARPEIAVTGAVAASWVLTLGLVATGQTSLVSHDAILEHGRLPLPVALVAFVAAWQLMTAAMMLPTTLPIVAVYARLASGQERPRAALGVFLGAYFVVWTGFAVAALAGDSLIHWTVDHWSWLDERPWLIGGSLLVGAGAFQLTSLKERCLTECRNPLQFVWTRYAPGLRGAWRLGVAHAMFCLGCCWALMLVVFGLGVGSFVLMAAVTGVMLLEKTSGAGARLVPAVSIALIGLGVFAIVAHPWLASLPAMP